MKDNISIIFTAIIGTFLIVILPLYSILDRQDSMSYNVVLTETTKLVDNIRNNGFLDRESYYNYLSALASTSNTYKVTIEAYRKTLIHDTDESGNIIEDTYVEEIELYNTKDILQVLDGEEDIDVEDSNKKNNVYLFEENDEIYVKVYNTNVTSGSILYTALVGPVNNKVIDISYGGVINDVNWELYNKIEEETVVIPEVVMTVPVNKNNNTNVVQINSDESIGDIDCTAEDLSIEELSICQDVDASEVNKGYQYLYDLSKQENKTIKIAIELKGIDMIDIGGAQSNYANLAELYATGRYNQSVANNIISNYIQLNGMYADKELKLRAKDDYYYFDLILTNVRSSSLTYISAPASVTILPGLGQDEDATPSLGTDSVEIRLLSNQSVNRVLIAGPYNWKKLLRTKSAEQSLINDNKVYVKQEIAFIVSYTGINGHSLDDIAKAIKSNLKIHSSQVTYSDVEVLTATEVQEQIGKNIGNIVIKLKYTEARNSTDNYVEIVDNWITTNIEGLMENEEGYYADGSKSSKYQILVDDLGPVAPKISVSGLKGTNGWYRSDVTVSLIGSTTDRIYQTVQTATTISKQPTVGGVGVEKNTIKLRGALYRSEIELLNSIVISQEGTTTATARAYDYLNNVSDDYETSIKIDKTLPDEPSVRITGTRGLNGWYKSNVKIQITPGKDAVSGVDRTTYKITGANAIEETVGTNYTLTKEGRSTLTVTTYDKAGNKSEKVIQINIEKSEPKAAIIEVIEGNKQSEDNEWYITDVRVRITLNSNGSASGLANSTYEVTGDTVISETRISDGIKEITFSKEGIHTITVYTRTIAGNIKETTYTVKIDKTPPQDINTTIEGVLGNNSWYKSDVTLNIQALQDNASGINKVTYQSTGANAIKETIGTSYTLTNEGKSTVICTVYDSAGLKVQKTLSINIEKSAPDDATIEVIHGEKVSDNNEWYISPVTLRLTANPGKSVSGIEDITYEVSGGVLPEETVISNTVKEITFNYNGTYQITVYTTTTAGNVSEATYTFKIDKTAPSKPTISIKQAAATQLYGVKFFNTGITVNINPGADTQSGVAKTTYKVTSNNGKGVVIDESIVNDSFIFNREGDYTIIARTYDNAGNYTEVSQAISINKQKPEAPTIVSINGEDVQDITSANITGNDREILVKVANVEQGNSVKLTILHEGLYTSSEIKMNAKENTVKFSSSLLIKGTYRLTVTQTNLYGTTSDENAGYYRYTYK